ncbi:hypothetical protein [Azospirillum sp. SYSU D00513]|uniref:hypothetical protein n=1 Tax=Azospirillum sp. SYSU D00513 TaxID=2812561 RepID=UPI001A95AAC3|nr:hypothetical protein [Azospirillum sp. SYSU D00513]
MSLLQRATTFIRQVLGGGAPAAGSSPNVTPFPASRPDGNGAATAARAPAAPAQQSRPAAAGSSSLAEKFVRDNRALFSELFLDGSGQVRGTVQGTALDRAFTSGKAGNLSPQAFRMAVVGCQLGSCPNDGVVLSKTGTEVLSRVLGR